MAHILLRTRSKSSGSCQESENFLSSGKWSASGKGKLQECQKSLKTKQGADGSECPLFRMLSSFSRINLSSGYLTVNPLRVNELKITELSDEDFMRYFNEGDAEIEANNYYYTAVLKLATTVTATFESDHNYVKFEYKFKLFSYCFRFILNFLIVKIFLFG